MTQRKLAALAPMSINTVRSVLRGNSVMMMTVEKLAKVLSVTPGDLILTEADRESYDQARSETSGLSEGELEYPNGDVHIDEADELKRIVDALKAITGPSSKIYVFCIIKSSLRLMIGTDEKTSLALLLSFVTRKCEDCGLGAIKLSTKTDFLAEVLEGLRESLSLGDDVQVDELRERITTYGGVGFAWYSPSADRIVSFIAEQHGPGELYTWILRQMVLEDALLFLYRREPFSSLSDSNELIRRLIEKAALKIEPRYLRLLRLVGTSQMTLGEVLTNVEGIYESDEEALAISLEEGALEALYQNALSALRLSLISDDMQRQPLESVVM